MSQEDIIEILRELGGSATTSEIRLRARAKYPERTLYLYVANRLGKLEKWGRVEKHFERDQMRWFLREK